MPGAKSQNARINNHLPVAREGLPLIFTGCAFTLFFSFVALLYPAVLAGILSLFTIFFFRDPDREFDSQKGAIFTPADGRIINIQQLNHGNNPFGGPTIKMSVFMSLFNVHVNRIPIDGRISEIAYHPGRFFSANLDKASEQNENNRITLETNDGHKIVFVQIAGLIARRIVCWIKEGDVVKSGQRCGLIRFGSRLDVYIPADSRIVAEVNDKARAGKTILGYLS